ncbi:hypothetical protein WA026_017821 [Henosepilachna vigintioctopunctata]|uniref:LAGLIDADG homing endonuclease n=1 Tax=Henosepilachna vigintioctopunctata TaxID=420089 RepID=A0AAW1TPW1_9CUCU
MDVSISENQKLLIDQIADREGFKQYKFCVNRGSLKGDGYMGTIYVVTIEENERKLDLILKTAHTDDTVRKKTPARSVYIRENFMYNVVFKEFSEIQKQYNVPEAFDALAKYYGGLDNMREECLLLENLREVGFTMWNRQKPMDSHHVETVMAQYGNSTHCLTS